MLLSKFGGKWEAKKWEAVENRKRRKQSEVWLPWIRVVFVFVCVCVCVCEPNIETPVAMLGIEGEGGDVSSQ